MSVVNLGAPQPQSIVVESQDGTKIAMPLVAVGIFSDGSMQTIANIVGQIVAQELDRRGLVPTDEMAATS